MILITIPINRQRYFLFNLFSMIKDNIIDGFAAFFIACIYMQARRGHMLY